MQTFATSCVLAVVVAAAGVPHATAGAPQASTSVWQAVLDDAVVNALVAETLARLPEIKARERAQTAERERVEQAGAWPDPMLELGIQNDGFRRIEVGNMESSYYSLMVQQQVPWPNKRSLSEQTQAVASRQAAENVVRARLAAEALVRGAYVDLVTVRARLAVLTKVLALWNQSVVVARTRYEASVGSQTDVLRAELELMRLAQQQAALRAQEQSTLQALNRLRGSDPGDSLETPASLARVDAAKLPETARAIEDALARSPELASARLEVEAAEQSMALAEKSYYPDLSVKAGIMYRGQSIPPMWLAAVAAPIPVFFASKQSHDVAASAQRKVSQQDAQDAVVETLGLRVVQRQAVVAGALATVGIYERGLLAHSEAVVESTRSQYRVGNVGLAAVLEANAAYLADAEGYIRAQALVHKTLIEAAVVSLDAPSVEADSAMSAKPMSSGGGAASASGGVKGMSSSTSGGAPASGQSGM